MEPKLTMLFALIAAIVVFSSLRAETLTRLRQIVVYPDWRLLRRRPNR